MPVRIALGQFNASLGDLEGNADRMRQIYDQAVKDKVDLLVFPEMAICGYPPEDLLLKKHFLEDNHLAVEKLAAKCRDLTIVVGFAESYEDKCYNSMAVLQAGLVKYIYRKCLLPNYGVFDERRYFQPGSEPVIIDAKGFGIALTICEDAWEYEWLADFLKNAGKKNLVLNISASPFHMGKINQRREILSKAAKTFNRALADCNLIRAQD